MNRAQRRAIARARARHPSAVLWACNDPACLGGEHERVVVDDQGVEVIVAVESPNES